MTAIELDSTRLEAFAGRMVGVINDGLLALSVSLGHQTGLFDAMYAELEELLRQLREAGVTIRELELDPTDLEEVFLRVMGGHG